MTDLLDPPVAEPATAPRELPTSVGRSASSWRLAARLARREVTRRLGRTALVLLLIAVPVAAMTVGSVIERSGVFDWSPWRDSTAGAGEVVVDVWPPSDRFTGELGAPIAPASGGDVDEQIAEANDALDRAIDSVLDAAARSVGDDATPTVVFAVSSVVVGETGREWATLADFTDGGLSPITEVFDGRAPSRDDEVFVSSRLAREFGVGVGDRLELLEPARSWTVVGIGNSTLAFDERTLIVGELDRSDVVPGRLSARISFDVPDEWFVAGPTDELGSLLGAIDRAAQNAQVSVLEPIDEPSNVEVGLPDTAVDTRALAWGWVAGVISLAAVGVVIAAAFATSARRQLTMIGQLSANGASERVVRRCLVLQGSWTGVVGAVAGVAVGLAIVVAGRSRLEHVVGRRLDEPVVAVLDLVVIVVTAVIAASIAALVPARSAARVPVLTALAGRRPVGSVPRWVAPTGVAGLVVGVGLLLLVAVSEVDGGDGGDLAAVVAVVGGLSVMVGIVCAAPLLVAAVGRTASRARGLVKLAGRSIDRQRVRSAAVVAALSVVMALTTALLTGLTMAEEGDVGGPRALFGDRAVTMSWTDPAQWRATDLPTGEVDLPRPLDVEPPSELVREIESIVGAGTVVPIEYVDIDPAPFRPDEGPPVTTISVVSDRLTAQLLGLSDDEWAHVEAGGVLVSPWTPGRSVVVEIAADIEAIAFDEIAVRSENSRALLGSDGVVVGSAWVEAQGLSTASSSFAYVADTPFGRGQQERLWSLQSRLDPFGNDSAFVSTREQRPVAVDPISGEILEPFWSVWTDGRSEALPWGTIQLIALAVALGLVVFVVAVGLGLAAVEGRDERDVLHVVGARPSTLRRLAAAKAWVMTTAAAVVGVPVGFGVVWVVRQASKSEYQAAASVPWVAAAAMLVVIPAVAAVLVATASSVAARVLPITASSLRLP